MIGLGADAVWVFVIWALLTVLQTATFAQLQGALRFDLAAWGNSVGAIVLLAGAWLFVTSGDLTSAFLVLSVTVFVPVPAGADALVWAVESKAATERPGRIAGS